MGQHKHPPLSYRPPEAERVWLKDRAERTGEPVNAILTEAVRTLMAAATPSLVAEDGGHAICPRKDHKGRWPEGAPPLDRYTDGSGRRSCPGVKADGSACGYWRRGRGA